MQTARDTHVKSFGTLVALCYEKGLIRAWQTHFLRAGGTS